MAPRQGNSPIGTFLIVGSVSFFLGVIFAHFPYDYHVLWAAPTSLPTHPGNDGINPPLDNRAPFYDAQEVHLKFLHASPPLIARILHIVVGTGLLGFILKLWKPNEANMLFDGASLALYICGIAVYVANIVKGMRTVTRGAYDGGLQAAREAMGEDVAEPFGKDASRKPDHMGGFIGREDTLKVLAASDTILALVLVGVLVLQAGQWYAQRKETEEIDAIEAEAKDRGEKRAAGGGKGGKKKQ